VKPEADEMQVNQLPVVVGVDGSETAASAARFALDEARRRSAPLHLVTAVPRPSDRLAALLEDDVALLRQVGEATAHAAAEALAGGSADVSVTAHVAVGHPVDVLSAASARAQLVVLGGRGVGGMVGVLLGSTAGRVVAQASCPVAVLPDDPDVLVRDRRTVVVGVEGRKGDEDVLAVAFFEAASRGTDLLVVHAWQEVVLDTSLRTASPLTDWAGVVADEERVLAEALAGWRAKEPDLPVREAVVRNRTAPALVAASMTAQLLVVGHRAGRFLGSTTQSVLSRASCPIAVVPIGSGADR
jgi:nucleotide-binding universal stress UspA family protein